MKISSKLNELKPTDLNCNVFDVYSYDGLSMQELLCQFFTKINECIKVSNETIDLASWLVNEGLKIEVVNKLMMWLEDGTLENIINVNLFNNLNTKIDNVNSQLTHVMLETPKVVNIEHFPKLDGELDDTNRFRRAIEYMKTTNNKTLFIPPQNGDYSISGRIVIDINSIRIQGQNVKTTRINYTSADACFEFIPITGVGYHAYDVRIENLQFYGNFIAKKALFFNVSSQIDLNMIEVNCFTECGIDMYKGSINSLYKTIISHSEVGLRITESTNIALYSMNMYKNKKDFQFVGLNDSICIYGGWSEESNCLFYMDNSQGNTRVTNLLLNGCCITGDPTYNTPLIDFRSKTNNYYLKSNVTISDSYIYIPDAEYLIKTELNGNTLPDTLINIVFEKNVVRKPLKAILYAPSTSNKVRMIYANNIESSNVTIQDGNALIGGINSGGSALSNFNTVNGSLILGTNTIPTTSQGEIQWDSSKKHIKLYDGNEYLYIPKCQSGTSRPNGVTIGQFFFDKNLMKPIWFMGTGWCDASGLIV